MEPIKNIITRQEYLRRHGKAESGYWVRIPEKWWRGALRGLRPMERCLMVSLRVWGARKPTKSQLARELGVSRLTIIRTFRKLRKKGVLQVYQNDTPYLYQNDTGVYQNDTKRCIKMIHTIDNEQITNRKENEVAHFHTTNEALFQKELKYSLGNSLFFLTSIRGFPRG